MFFSKKEEVLMKPKKKEKRIKLPKPQPMEDMPQDDFEPDEVLRSDEDAYADSFMPSEMEESEPEPQPRRVRAKKEKPAPKRKKPPRSEAPFYRNRLFIGATSVIVACLIAFVLVPLMSYVTSTEMSTVVKVIAPVEKGKQIVATMVQTVQSPAMGVTGDALRDASEAVGKYAAVDMVMGDTVLNSKLAETAPYSDEYLYALGQGEQAISLTIQSFAGGLSGKLVSGDIVSVYATPTQTDAAATEAERGYSAIQPPELTYMRVLAVTDKLGGDKQLESDTAASSSGAAQEEDTQPVTVTVLADPIQAAAVAGLETNSKLHLSLVSRGDEKAAKRALDAQQDFLAQQLAEKESEYSTDDLEAMLNELLAEENGTSTAQPSSDKPTTPKMDANQTIAAQEKTPVASNQSPAPATTPKASGQPPAPAKTPAASSQPPAPAKTPTQGEVTKGE